MSEEKRLRILHQLAFTERMFGADEAERALQSLSEDPACGRVGTAREGWEEFERGTRGCKLCRLWEGRTQVVIGEGCRKAPLMFVGEGPGFDEDRQGRPFVGKAGQLLTRIIEAMGMKREDVYIANCVKCRPPENRNPFPDEIALCKPHLEKQIGFIKPKVICALGKFAAQTLLDTEVPITRLRGQFHDCRGIKVMPTFHPAYLLRNPSDKRLVWEDMKKVMTELSLHK